MDLIKKISFNKEMGIIALFLTMFIILKLVGTLDFALTDSSKLYISQATKDGVDISKRISLFFKVLISFAIYLPVIYILLTKIKSRIYSFQGRSQNSVILAFIGILLILTKFYGLKTDVSISFVFTLFLISFALLFVQVEKLKGKSYQQVLPVIFVVGFLILTLFLVLFNARNHFPRNPENVYFFIVGVLSVSFLILKKLKVKLSRTYIKYLLPLALIPVFVFISIEAIFYFKLKHDLFIPYEKVFLVMLFTSFLVFFAINYFKKINISTHKALSLFFIPSALLCFILLTIYYPFIEQATETFELANSANSMMNIFQFHQFPFVDFMSSHLFSEQFYGIIYTSIFGYSNDMGFMSYQFFYQLIFYFLVYAFLLRLFKRPLLVFAFILFFPFLHTLFNTHLMYSVLAFFAFRKCIQKQSIGNYILLAFTMLFLILWKLDTGAATLLSMLVFIPLTFHVENKRIEWRKVIKAGILFLLLLSIVFLIFVQIRSLDYLLGNIQNALHYTTANQAHGYSTISTTTIHQFTNLLLLLPFVAVLSIFYIIITLKTNFRTLSSSIKLSLSSSLFFFLIYLANFQRGLVRHSFMENTDYFLNTLFYIALALFIFSYIKTRSSSLRFIIFTSLSFIILVFVKYYPLNQGKSEFEKLLTQNSLIGIDTYFNAENFKGRVIENKEFAENNYLQIEKFLDRNISAEQTFYDFSNTPTLYYYTNRKVPFYFCQNLQNTVDDHLQLKQIQELEKTHVPVVVYSNYPLNWFDLSDDVPNPMRYYLLAEYIYTHYKPFEVINKHSVWIDKNKGFPSFSGELDTVSITAKTYYYDKAAMYINEHFERNSDKIKLLANAFPIKSTDTNSVYFTIPKAVRNKDHVFVKVYTENTIFYKVKLEILEGDKILGTNSFQIVPKQNKYMSRLTNHYLWHHSKPDKIRIRKNTNFEIIKLEFYIDER